MRQNSGGSIKKKTTVDGNMGVQIDFYQCEEEIV